MAQNKPKSVAQLNRENKALTRQVENQKVELAMQQPTIEGQRESIDYLQKLHSERTGKIIDMQRQLADMRNGSLPVQRALVLNIARELTNVARNADIPVCLFIDKGGACEYYTTATAGQAIDMFSNVAMQNPHAGTVMGHALSLAETLVQVSEN